MSVHLANFIPYKRIRFETALSPHEVGRILQASVSRADWNLSLDKAVQNRILEGKIDRSSFLLVMGRYGLTYGRTSLLPIAKGGWHVDAKKDVTVVDVVIRPYLTGMFILGFSYLLILLGFIANAHALKTSFVVFAAMFVGVTYSSLMIQFNHSLAYYKDFFRSKLGDRSAN